MYKSQKRAGAFSCEFGWGRLVASYWQVGHLSVVIMGNGIALLMMYLLGTDMTLTLDTFTPAYLDQLADAARKELAEA